jgi:hypothetical protein
MAVPVISSVAGTRTEPKDAYLFTKGTHAIFKTVFMSNGYPTVLDNNTFPVASVFQPHYLYTSNNAVPLPLVKINGTLVPGQEFEYMFEWDIPDGAIPADEYIIQYAGKLGNITLTFGDEFFTIVAGPGQVDVKMPSYATVDDVRMTKFNIDDYLPKIWAQDLAKRNMVIEYHIRQASIRLKEELCMFKARSNSENYRLFCIFYTIWSLMLAARGEDSSSVSDSNLATWKDEWNRVLSQEKREGVTQAIPLGRG